MNYDLKKYVDRFQWRFSKDENGNFKQFKPNYKDVEAINNIFEWINRQKKETLKNNVLFAKLFIYFLNQNIRHYETTVLDEFPQKEITKILRTPLHLFYKAFYEDIKFNQINKLSKENTSEENDEIIKQHKELLESFTLKLVSDKLADLITEALNKYSDDRINTN